MPRKQIKRAELERRARRYIMASMKLEPKNGKLSEAYIDRVVQQEVKQTEKQLRELGTQILD